VLDVDAAVSFVNRELAARADPATAVEMARYLKTDMPFYGVKTPDRKPIAADLARRWIPDTAADYERLVLALWHQPHREVKYLALGVAERQHRFITLEAVPLFRRLIVEGAWWDLVDGVAANLVGGVLLHERAAMTPLVRRWLDDEVMWLRRTTIISQLNHKAATDAALLFDGCAARAHETEFFIRKAIGWALRQYARTDPQAVRQFVEEQGEKLSGLSRREAMKHL
jgi:3-methyladenine DNA glycosylase AlkD